MFVKRTWLTLQNEQSRINQTKITLNIIYIKHSGKKIYIINLWKQAYNQFNNFEHFDVSGRSNNVVLYDQIGQVSMNLKRRIFQ